MQVQAQSMLAVRRSAGKPKMPADGGVWLPQNFFSIFLPHKLSLNLLGIFVKKWLGCLKLGGYSLKKLQFELRCRFCAKVGGGTTRVCSLLNVIKKIRFRLAEVFLFMKFWGRECGGLCEKSCKGGRRG